MRQNPFLCSPERKNNFEVIQIMNGLEGNIYFYNRQKCFYFLRNSARIKFKLYLIVRNKSSLINIFRD